ncbi:thioesterase domain-containing protein [Streptomyces sp. NPDC013455]|uniref:thioesterase II family protein n=1 Tax=Streptomyces sp. NPDC013455 TaxID=3155605 RepID=UPI0033FE3CBA
MNGTTAAADRPALRLFLFHHAGGSSALYDGWAERFPADWDIVRCDAPGRGSKLGVPPRDDVEALVAHFHEELAPASDVPFAFFGHSMGACVAYELALRLQRAGEPGPFWLGLSACAAPRPGHVPEARSRYAAEQLQDWLVAAGGTDRDVARHPLVWRMLEPALRGDLRVIESWRPEAGRPPLDAALTVFGGTGDALVAPRELADWRRHSGTFTGCHLHDGGHFYLRERPAQVIGQIVREIDRCRGALVPAYSEKGAS